MTSRSAFVFRADGALTIYQYAGDRLDYGLNYDDLLSEDDAIVSSEWAATGGVTISAPVRVGATCSITIADTGGRITHTVETLKGLRKVTSFCVVAPAISICV